LGRIGDPEEFVRIEEERLVCKEETKGEVEGSREGGSLGTSAGEGATGLVGELMRLEGEIEGV
jgi:hypothetical protein